MGSFYFLTNSFAFLFVIWFCLMIFLFFVLIFMLVIEELVFWILGFVLYRWWSLVLAMLNAYLCEVLFLMAICSEIWAQLSRILSLVWSWELKLKWEVRDHCLNFVWKVCCGRTCFWVLIRAGSLNFCNEYNDKWIECFCNE